MEPLWLSPILSLNGPEEGPQGESQVQACCSDQDHLAPCPAPHWTLQEPRGGGSQGRVAEGPSPPPTGSLIQVPMSEKGKITRGRLGSLSLKKEGERQCFLFSKHLIICTRGSGGKLHLTKVGGQAALC